MVLSLPRPPHHTSSAGSGGTAAAPAPPHLDAGLGGAQVTSLDNCPHFHRWGVESRSCGAVHWLLCHSCPPRSLATCRAASPHWFVQFYCLTDPFLHIYPHNTGQSFQGALQCLLAVLGIKTSPILMSPSLSWADVPGLAPHLAFSHPSSYTSFFQSHSCHCLFPWSTPIHTLPPAQMLPPQESFPLTFADPFIDHISLAILHKLIGHWIPPCLLLEYSSLRAETMFIVFTAHPYVSGAWRCQINAFWMNTKWLKYTWTIR